MESTQWIPLDVKRPSAQVEVVLACVDIHDNVVHALWWLSLQGEWIITAIPASDAAIKEVSHWCMLPTSKPGYRKADAWPWPRPS